jgi:hypothetical protein
MADSKHGQNRVNNLEQKSKRARTEVVIREMFDATQIPQRKL